MGQPLPEVSTIADDNEDVDDATNPFEDDGNDLRNDAGTQETPLTNETSPASKGPSSEDVDAPAPAALKVLQPKFKSTGAGAKQPVRDVKRPVAPAKPPQGSVSATLEKQSIAGGWLETKQNTTHMDSPAATAEKSTTATSFGTVSNGDLRAAVFEEDGSLLMYWLDAFEARDGTVYLFGKVRAAGGSGQTVLMSFFYYLTHRCGIAQRKRLSAAACQLAVASVPCTFYRARNSLMVVRGAFSYLPIRHRTYTLSSFGDTYRYRCEYGVALGGD